jgi:Ca2+-binding RTX toxin-like protein
LAANVENLNLTGTAENGVGNDLDNTIVGNNRANRLDGGNGSDTLVGGSGNDTYVINSSGDVAIELAGGGTDTIEASIDYTLADNVENLVLTATAINGTGNSGNNIITGNDANNTLIGGLGNDTFTGGLGNDTFVLNNPRQGVDILKDFVSGSDVISISAGGYGGGLTAGVALDSSQLRVAAGATSASTSSQRFILNSNNGNLYFDSDGLGGNGAIRIAKLEGITTLSTNDFQIG